MEPGLSRKIAVCIPAFNAADTIRASIESVLNQTYPDFLLVITDDGSTDDTIAVISSIDDPRIHVLRHEHNRGLANTRNTMLEYCIEQGFQYMALMDADDLVTPDKLTRQLSILDANPALSVCGGSMHMEYSDAPWNAPVTHPRIVAEMLFANPIPGPTAIFRVADLDAAGLRWDQSFVPCEDYHFWYRFFFQMQLKAENTGQVEGVYRYSAEGLSHRDGRKRQEQTDAEIKRMILRHFGIEVTSDESYGFMKVALYRRATVDDVKAFTSIAHRLQADPGLRGLDSRLIAECIAVRTGWLLRHARELTFVERCRLRRDLVSPERYLLREAMQLPKLFRDRWLAARFPGLAGRMTSIYNSLKSRCIRQ